MSGIHSFSDVEKWGGTEAPRPLAQWKGTDQAIRRLVEIGLRAKAR